MNRFITGLILAISFVMSGVAMPAFATDISSTVAGSFDNNKSMKSSGRVSHSSDSDFFGGGFSGVLSTASNYLGLHERSNTGTLRRVTGVNPARTPWCAAFVNGVLRQSGRRGTGSNSAASFRNYGNATSAPAGGDIALVRRRGGSGYHVGFFKGYVTRNGRTMVAIVGGNQSNRVSVSYYPAGKVSFRRV